MPSRACRALTRRRGRLKELLAKLRAPVQIPPDVATPSQPAVSSFRRSAVQGGRGQGQAVHQGRRHHAGRALAAHDQALLGEPDGVYRALRTLNPSPYMYYFDCDDFHIVGASPEILVRLEHENGEGVVTVRPIAGTRKRGASHDEDLALEKELLADQKERAEHVQLLDLGRNDVGRVAQVGGVKVTET